MNRHLGFLGLAIALFSLSITCQSAHAALYFFSQSGFDRDGLGGRVTGSFKGVDRSGLVYYEDLTDDSKLIPDGIITTSCPRCGMIAYSGDVITDLKIQFSGNPFFESLNKKKEALLYDFGLTYDISKNTLTFGTQDSSRTFQYNSEVGIIMLGDDDTVLSAYVTQPMVVSQVPLPSAIIFLIPGLLGLGLLRRKVKV
jgi:hypothetical protein